MTASNSVLYRAAWLVPISSPPLRDGWLTVADGRITGLGARSARPADEAARTVDLGQVALLPGLVNAHTHLELSGLRGSVPPAPSMPAWVRTLMERRPAGPPAAEPIVQAIEEARAAGTVAVGDVGNTLASFEPLSRSRLRAVLFRELIGFAPGDPGALVRQVRSEIQALPSAATIRVTLAAHAPYSVSPELFAAVRDALGRSAIWSVHLGESREEVEFLETGKGPWRNLLEQLSVMNPRWTPPACGPVEYLERLKLLGPGLLVVHGVQFTDEDLAKVAGSGATIVTCPRSNRWTGAGTPPAARFYASGAAIAVGTDSLASSPDLNVFAELAELRRLAPSVPARRLLDSATRQGARALGFAGDLGTLDPGRCADVLTVAIPDGVGDVEEYLVSGVERDRIAWLEDGSGRISHT